MRTSIILKLFSMIDVAPIVKPKVSPHVLSVLVDARQLQFATTPIHSLASHGTRTRSPPKEILRFFRGTTAVLTVPLRLSEVLSLLMCFARRQQNAPTSALQLGFKTSSNGNDAHTTRKRLISSF